MTRAHLFDRLKKKLTKEEQTRSEGPPLFDGFPALMDQHLIRMETAYSHMAGFLPIGNVIASLRHPEVMIYAQTAGVLQLPTALRENRHCWQTHPFPDLCLIVSILPALYAEDAKRYFGGQYFSFLETCADEMGVAFMQFPIAHWVLCSDGSLGGVHLTLVPGTADALVVFAQDMLTPTEKMQVGL